MNVSEIGLVFPFLPFVLGSCLACVLRLWLGLATQCGWWLNFAPTKFTESNNYHVTLSDDSWLT